jgi:hypothetical protein
MKNKLDVEAIIDKIRSVEDVRLKPITDIVAFKISKSPDDKGPENNFTNAEKIVAEYISESYSTLDEFCESLSKSGEGIKGIQTCADAIYQYYTDSDRLSFDTVKERISSKKDITLKTITDLVAYKISQSPDDKGVDLNFISAQTFVAEYVSKKFRSKTEFENKLSKLGKDMKGLNAFADIVFKHFVKKDR